MQKKIKNNVISGTLALSAAALLTKIFGVIFKVPLSYLLLDEGMGYFNSAYTIYGFFYVLSCAGLPKAVTIVVAEINKDNHGEIYAFLKRIVKYSFFIGIAFSLIYTALAPVFSYILGNSKTLPCLLAIAPCIVCVTVCGVIRGYLNGNMTFLPIAISQIIEAILKLGVGLALAYLAKSAGLGLNMISAFSIFGITVGCIISTFYLLIISKRGKTSENIRQNNTLSVKYYFSKILKIAVPITLSSALLSLSGIFDLGIIINRLEGIGVSKAEAMALYGNYTTLAIPMLNLVTALLMPLSVAYLGKLSTLVHCGKMNDFSYNINKSIDFIGFAAAPCMMAYYFYAFDILDILFEVTSSALGYRLLIVISPAVLLLPLLTMINTALEACGGVYYAIWSLLGGAFIKIILSYFLIGNPAIGIMGAAISTVVSYFISIIISTLLLKIKGINNISFGRVIKCVSASLLSFGLIFYALYMEVNAKYSIISAPLSCFLSLILYFALLFLVALFKKYGKKLLILHKI